MKLVLAYTVVIAVVSLSLLAVPLNNPALGWCCDAFLLGAAAAVFWAIWLEK